MLARELAIALRARATWLQAALAALLVGHGFVLAVDLYTSGSRSVRGNILMAREFDPLLGIVRPTLGGLYLAVSLLGPLAAARPLSIEKERGGWHALLLQVGSPARVVGTKFVAGLAAIGLQLACVLVLLVAWRAVSGHLAPGETIVALAGYALYVVLVAAISVAAAAWTRTLAQAATAALLVVAASWAIDAAEGFAALAWLGRAIDWSVTTHLQPMERGTLAAGACAWMAVAAIGALALAVVGARYDLPPIRRGALTALVVAATGATGALTSRFAMAFDLTEERRASLPPAAAEGLRTIPGSITVEMWLDRDDARRRQFESDTLAKLRLARPDLVVRAPLDDRAAPVEGERDEGYGRIVVAAGGGRRETMSISRRETITLIFEAAGRTLPDWSKREYPGYPLVVEGLRRDALAALAYLVLPLGLAGLGWTVTRSRRRR